MAEEDGAWRRIENFERQPISRIFLREAMQAQKKREHRPASEDLEAAIFAAEKDNRRTPTLKVRRAGKKIAVSGVDVGVKNAKPAPKSAKIVVTGAENPAKTASVSGKTRDIEFPMDSFESSEVYSLSGAALSKHSFDQEITMKFLRDNPEYYAYVAAERARHQEKMSIVEDFQNIKPVTFRDLKAQILKLMSGALARPEEARLEDMEMKDRMRVFEREKVLTFLYWTEFLQEDFRNLSPAFGFGENAQRISFGGFNGFSMVMSFDFQGAKCIIAESSRAPAETYFCRNLDGKGSFYFLDHSTAKNAQDTLDAAFSKILLYLMSGGEEMIRKYAEQV